MIARTFTLGQLALIAWRMGERWQAVERHDEIVGHDVDLRRMTGSELSLHLAQLGT